MTTSACRICLGDTKVGHSIAESIGEWTIWSSIGEIGSIPIELEDELPQIVCDECLSELKSAMELREKIIVTDKKLQTTQPDVKMETLELEIKVEEEEFRDNEDVEIPPEPLRRVRKRPEPPPGKNKLAKKRLRKDRTDTSQCCMCADNFDTEAELKKHCKDKHPEGRAENKPLTQKHKYACLYCHRKFRMKKFLTEHFLNIDYQEPKRDRTKDIQYKKNYYDKQAKKVCSICGLQLRDQRSLEVHEVSKHSSIRNIVCGIDGCKAAFGHEIVMKKHQRACHSEKKYTCDYCGKGFVYFRQLKQHIFLHMEVKPYKCTQCDRSYTLERVLAAHIIASHSEVEYPFQCDLCEKAYKWKEDLRAHRSAYHFGKFPFVCKYCGKGYTSSSNRNWHEKRCTLGQAQRMAEIPSVSFI